MASMAFSSSAQPAAKLSISARCTASPTAYVPPDLSACIQEATSAPSRSQSS